ncbi:MATE family efflux transporter [Fibrella sp. HMF5335]|uniref:Multidrug-efflux transporter n=1 Tax=Fibrella rubiginis TaxID=2817060 RepID=A0A939GLI4_9BACT|nr:MATE family efflux transporter [Fibrella rubiginis]MBO0939554.1 MATE family efflux transporter [Fibrella rubiginis]
MTLRANLTDTLRLSIPIVIAQLSTTLMGLTDNLFVGRLLGAVPLGAAGLANSMSFLLSSIGIGGLPVVAALVAQAGGRNNAAKINQLYRAGLRVALLLSLALGLVVAVVALNFDWLGQTAEVNAIARPFMLILSASNVPLFVFIAARQLGDGLRFPRVSMTITIAALALNALFNYLFILGIGPFPKLGVQGSAVATLLSRVFMAVAMLTYIHRSGLFREYVQPAFSALPVREFVRDILRLGLPSGLTFFFEIALFTAAMVIIGWLGADRLAAHQIAINMASSTYMMATGISSAAAIRVGAALGRGDRDGVRRAGLAAFLLSAMLMGTAGLVFILFNTTLVNLYISDAPGRGTADVIRIAATLVFLAGFFQLSDGIQAVGIGTLRGLSDVNVPTLITLFSYWLVALPTSYLLGFTFGYDAVGVWLGLLVGLSVAAVLLTVRFFQLAERVKE